MVEVVNTDWSASLSQFDLGYLDATSQATKKQIILLLSLSNDAECHSVSG